MSFCSFEDENENDILKNFPLNSIFEKIHFRFISSYLLYNLFTVVKQSERRSKQERDNRMHKKTLLNFITGLSLL